MIYEQRTGALRGRVRIHTGAGLRAEAFVIGNPNEPEHRANAKRTRASRNPNQPDGGGVRMNPEVPADVPNGPRRGGIRTNPSGYRKGCPRSSTGYIRRNPWRGGIQSNPSGCAMAVREPPGVESKRTRAPLRPERTQASLRPKRTRAPRDSRAAAEADRPTDTETGRAGQGPSGREVENVARAAAALRFAWRSRGDPRAPRERLTGSSRNPTRRRRPAAAPGAADSRPATRGRTRGRARGRRRPWR